MIKFKALIEKFNEKGEKSGWCYIEITSKQAEKLKPGQKTSFRVKGKIDGHTIKQTALLPMGEGNFILPINNSIRKAIGKTKGDSVVCTMEVDDSALQLSEDFMTCLADDTKAMQFFQSLAKSHQQYFSKWIESAKTDQTKAKRITMAVTALSTGQGYGEMIRSNKKKSDY